MIELRTFTLEIKLLIPGPHKNEYPRSGFSILETSSAEHSSTLIRLEGRSCAESPDGSFAVLQQTPVKLVGRETNSRFSLKLIIIQIYLDWLMKNMLPTEEKTTGKDWQAVLSGLQKSPVLLNSSLWAVMTAFAFSAVNSSFIHRFASDSSTNNWSWICVVTLKVFVWLLFCPFFSAWRSTSNCGKEGSTKRPLLQSS